jgi:hypothetical protein
MLVDETEKKLKQKKKKKKTRKNQASLGELCKSELIFQISNLLNYRPELN